MTVRSAKYPAIYFCTVCWSCLIFYAAHIGFQIASDITVKCSLLIKSPLPPLPLSHCHRYHCLTVTATNVSLPPLPLSHCHRYHCLTATATIVTLPPLPLSHCHRYHCITDTATIVSLPPLPLSHCHRNHGLTVSATIVSLPPLPLSHCHRNHCHTVSATTVSLSPLLLSHCLRYHCPTATATIEKPQELCLLGTHGKLWVLSRVNVEISQVSAGDMKKDVPPRERRQIVDERSWLIDISLFQDTSRHSQSASNVIINPIAVEDFR